MTAIKDPGSPAQANDAAIREYKQLMAKYAPNANANNSLHIYGFGLAETLRVPAFSSRDGVARRPITIVGTIVRKR